MKLIMSGTPEPAFCKSGLWHKPLTASQWKTCWNYGWNEPVSPVAHHAGGAAGSAIVPVLIALAVAFVIWRLVRSRRTPVGTET